MLIGAVNAFNGETNKVLCQCGSYKEVPELAKIYNGLGPDSFPRWLRAVLTDFNPLLRPVAYIHDIEWHEADGSREAFDASNKRWKRNGYRVAQVEFRAWDPRRYLLMNRVRRFGNYCQAFGWSAWRTPSKEVQA